MTNQRVITLENPAGLLITPELLEQIGVSTGDQIEISVSERRLIVRPLSAAEIEKRKTDPLNGDEAGDDESTVTFRELIYEELKAKRVSRVAGVKVALADGRKLLFHHTDDPQLDEVIRRADIRELSLLYSGEASGPTADGDMEDLKSIMDRYNNLFRRLAEGAK